MKNSKGITLVALVVTIIVLIILAGISINLTLGNNGIITIAKKAKENVEIAKIEEEKQLNELYTQLEAEGGNSSGGSNYDAIEKLIEFKKAIANAIGDAGGVKPEFSAGTSVFEDNIKGIVKEVTKNATATTEDIAEGKTAWVNGELIVGTLIKQANIVYIGSTEGYYKESKFDVSSYEGYENFTIDNFFIKDAKIELNKAKGYEDLGYYYSYGTTYLDIMQKSYDNSNGIFTIRNKGWGYGNSSVGLSKAEVYLIF